MQLQANQGDRLRPAHITHRGMPETGWINYRNRSSSHYFHVAVRPDKTGRILIDTESAGKRIERQGRQQPAHALALVEMLIDDDAVGEAQSRRQFDPAFPGGRAAAATGNHVLRHDGGARRGSSHVDAFGIQIADQMCYRRSTQNGRQSKLVAAGDKIPVALSITRRVS